MKLFLSFLTLLILLGGCSRQSAFEHFGMDSEQERIATHMRMATLTDEKRQVKVFFNAVYLNTALPEKFDVDGNDHFYVGMYLEEVQFNHSPSNLTLNGQEPVRITTLGVDDPLRAMIPVESEWSEVFEVTFKGNPDITSPLTLLFESGRFGSVALTFEKETE